MFVSDAKIVFFAVFSIGTPKNDYICQKPEIMVSTTPRNFNFEHISDVGVELDYKDDDIVFYTDLQKLSFKDKMRIDMYVVLGCISGNLRIEINGREIAQKSNELIVIRPGDIYDECTLSEDFRGCVLCMSKRGLVTELSDIDLWDRAFRFIDEPLLHVDEDCMKMISLYGEILRQKSTMKRTTFKKQIILSIFRASMYELLACIDESKITSHGAGLKNRQEVIFKDFMKHLLQPGIRQRKLGWYADRLCISPKYLSAVCRQVTGKTASEWITDYVLRDIRYWLRDSDKSMKEITNLLGFPDISFFGKYCRKHLGMSPTRLRKQLRTQPD